jgi:hypothetical protein
MGKKSGSGSGIRDEQAGSYFLDLRNHFLGLKYLNSLMDPGSGMETIRIRDPGWEKVGSGINIPDLQHCMEDSPTLDIPFLYRTGWLTNAKFKHISKSNIAPVMVLVVASTWNPNAQIINCKNKITINDLVKSNVPNPWHIGTDPESVLLTNGSGSYCSVTFKTPQKIICSQIFLLITFSRYIYIILPRLKVIKGHKIVELKLF